MKNNPLTPAQTKTLKQAAKTGTLKTEEMDLNGGARQKVLKSLISKGFLMETQAPDTFGISPQGKEAIGCKEEQAAAPTQKGKIRTGTKLHSVIELLSRPEGATISDIMKATCWQQHTVRGTLAGALKKRLGLTIESEKPEGKERTYRITGGLEAITGTKP